MFRKIVLLTASALVASVAVAGPAPAAEYDVQAAQAELTDAARITWQASLKGFTATGLNPDIGPGVLDFVADSAGVGRMVSRSNPTGLVTYAGVDLGRWNLIPPKTRKASAAALAHMGKPKARYTYEHDDEFTLYGGDILTGADGVSLMRLNDFSSVSVDKVDDGSGHVTYAFTAHNGEPDTATYSTLRLTDGLVTGYKSVKSTNGTSRRFHDLSWTYAPQAPIVLPTAAQSVTPQELILSRCAVVLGATVRAYARETAARVRARVKREKRKATVADIRVAAAQIVYKYSKPKRYLKNALPTTTTNLTGGAALHATDPFKHKVRISTVRLVKGKVVVSS